MSNSTQQRTAEDPLQHGVSRKEASMSKSTQWSLGPALWRIDWAYTAADGRASGSNTGSLGCIVLPHGPRWQPLCSYSAMTAFKHLKTAHRASGPCWASPKPTSAEQRPSVHSLSAGSADGRPGLLWPSTRNTAPGACCHPASLAEPVLTLQPSQLFPLPMVWPRWSPRRASPVHSAVW